MLVLILFGGGFAFGQGTFSPVVYNTTAGQSLISGQSAFSFDGSVSNPLLELKFGFATDEVLRPGIFGDSFTLTIQDDLAFLTMVLVTADPSGVVWAPPTPGATLLAESSIQRMPIDYPSLTPSLNYQWAYDIKVALPQEAVGQPLTLYFDLFNNDNGIASQGWFADLNVVPEPATWGLLLAGGIGLLAFNQFDQRKLIRGHAAKAFASNAASDDESRFSGNGTSTQRRRGHADKWLRFFTFFLLAAGVLLPLRADAQTEQAFHLNGGDITLQEASSDVSVFFSSMRLNRALNVWNVEVAVTNTSARVLAGPLVLLVDSSSGTTGIQLSDGTTASGKQFLDLSGWSADASLAPGQGTGKRTLTLGRSGTSAPSLVTKFFVARPPKAAALGITRSLNDAGQPLPGVELDIAGPAGSTSQLSDSPSGVASFGQGPGEHIVKFVTDGYLPVWRKQNLTLDQTAVLPNPRLTKRAENTFVVSPLGGTQVTNATSSITIDFGAGIVNQNTTVTLTPLTGQNLPAFLPLGWSPLSEFWIEANSSFASPLAAKLKPAGAIRTTEMAALVKWNTNALQWSVEQTVPGNGTNVLNVSLGGTGAYALVVADIGETAPPPAQVGAALQGYDLPAEIDAAGLTAEGSVTPPASPASVIPALVTGTANLKIQHATAKLPSGYLLRGEVTESYLLSDGSLRLTPQYEQYIVGYQRPGDQDPQTLNASFPMRPVLLFGPDQLDEAAVRVEVLPQGTFDGIALDDNGGQIGADGIRVLAGSGQLTGPSALRLRRVDSTVFTNLMADGFEVVGAFDLTVDRSTVSGGLVPQLTGAPTNGLFVLARVLSDVGIYGLQPIERLQSDANGNLNSREPTTGEALPGLRGSGQYVLVEVAQPQGLISGVARNGQGNVQAGMPVRLTGLPWLTLTDDQGRYQLVAPTGDVEVGVTDPTTGDTGFATVNIPDPQTPVGQDLGTAPAGPRVASISPTDGATRVQRVTSIVIRFNEAVNPATVVGNRIQLLKPDDSVVSAALTLNLKNTTATLSPATELDASTTYRVRLASTIADPTGLPLEGSNEFTFTTVAPSTRISTAQLVIYEPGATNVPVEIQNEIPAFTPGEDPFAIVVHGQPGVADPGVPVVLVNESSGETQTVISKLDGSFSSFISGTEEDFVSATFINLNGTRVYVPVSRQEFDNGFVGLYTQGGILEAESDGGPVQIYIQPNAVPSRTKFRLKTLSASELTAATGGVTPQFGTVAGNAVKIEVEGQTPTEPMQMRFPVDLAKFGYPTNADPANAAAVLARVRDEGGVTTYEVLDQLKFTPRDLAPEPFVKGRVNTRDFGNPTVGDFTTLLGFAPSLSFALAAPLVIEYVAMPLILGANPVLVKGVTQYLPEGDTTPTSGAIDSFSQGVVNQSTESFNSALIVNPIQGAFVVLRTVANPVNGAGHLQPGMVHATSGANGKYTMVAPAANQGYIITATHPAYTDTPSADIKPVTDIDFAGAVFDRLIFHTPNPENAPLRVNVSHSPYYPAPNETCEIQVSAFRGAGESPEILVRVLSVTNLTVGDPATLDDVTLTNTASINNGVTRLWKGTLTAKKAVQVVLKFVIDGKISNYQINFSGIIPPVVHSDLPKPDTNDISGPIVVSTFPPEGGYIGPSGELTFLFNKPIDRYVEQANGGVILDGPTAATSAQPVIRLDSSQKALVVQYAGLSPGEEYTVTLSSQAVRDLAGQPLDQRPSTPEPDSFRLNFRAAPVRTSTLPLIENGRGTTIRGRYLYALDASASYSSLLTYDLQDPGRPVRVDVAKLFGQPRDMVLIPQYGYKVYREGPSMTNDLLVVAGGDLDTRIDNLGNVTVKGQYLTVFDLSNPAAPHQVASVVVSYRVSSAVTKVEWSAPNLIYQEYGQDIQQIGLVNLQEVIIGFNQPTVLGEFRAGREGADLNGDGDYVDENEVVPIPQYPPAEFYGKKQAYVLYGTTQKILDFHAIAAGQLVGVTLTRGQGRDVAGHDNGARYRPSYRTLALNLNNAEPTTGLFKFDDSAYPRWVSVFPSLPIITNKVLIQPVTALVSLQPDSDGKQVLAVLDITLPLSPQLINKIAIPSEILGGAMQSVRKREDGLLELAGSQNILLLDSRHFGDPEPIGGQLHQSIVGFVPATGAGSRTLGETDYGYRAVADGGRDVLVQTVPEMEFVNFPGSSELVNPSRLAASDENTIESMVSTMRSAFAIPPARARSEPTLNITSDLNPPKAPSHYYVHVRAPGTSGETIELGLESVNHAGRPLANFGNGYAPVRAISDPAQDEIGQKPRAECGAPIRSLTAWRMSDVPTSPFYNQYLSRPFALVANETLSSEEITALKAMVDREILYSGAGLRAFIDPSQSGNKVIGPFAARVDAGRKLIQPISTAYAVTLFHPYIMGNNPPPVGGYVALPGTFGAISAHSGEFRTEAVDIELPSPRMPIVVERAIGNQDHFEGPFGVGWDFNYNQRITELDPRSFPFGLQMPLIVRGTSSESDIAGSQDVLFQTGMGRTLRFRWVSTNMPPEYQQDPLVIDFDYQTRVSDYYLPAKAQGIFELLVKFKDGRFERLTPDGTRYRYAPNGRLETILDRFPANRHQLEYDRNGWLIRIDDKSVKSPRYVEFGHYRAADDPDFNGDLDEATTNPQWEGKIHRLRDFVGRDVLFYYSDDGFLIRREGFQMAGENGGFAGRTLTQYNYQNCKIVGVTTGAEGTPLFNANVIEDDSGKPVAQSGVSASPVEFAIPLNNSAASLNGETSTGTQADGRITAIKFDASGHPTSVKTSGGKGDDSELKSQLSEDGLLTSLTFPEGRIETHVYDSENPVFRSRGNLLSTSVDPGPRGGSGYSESFNYDPRYNQPSGVHIDANGFTHVFALQSDGRELVSIDHGESGAETLSYNDHGQLLASTDVRGINSVLRYDDSTGFATASILGGKITSLVYDNSTASQLGNPSTIIPPAGASTVVKYNSALQVVQSTRDTLTVRRAYDERSHEIFTQEVLGDGQESRFRRVYNERGFMTSLTMEGVEVDGAPRDLEFLYTPDELYRVKAIKHPDGTIQTFAYDKRDQIIKVTLGTYVTEIQRDRHGNIVETKEGGDVVSTANYDGLDRPKVITRKTGSHDETTESTYFPGGQARSVVISDPVYGISRNMDLEAVDEMGRPKQTTLKGNVISPSTSYKYLPLESTSVGPRMTVRSTWNASGDALRIENPVESTTYHPDAAGRIEQIDHVEDGFTYQDFFTYNGLDQLVTQTDLQGLQVKYTPRNDGKNLSIANGLDHSTDIQYSVLGEALLRHRPDGMEFRYRHDSERKNKFTGDPTAGFTYSYDDQFRLTQFTQRDGQALIYKDFDAREMPQTVTLPGNGFITTEYDLQRRPTHRVTSFDGTSYEETYSYDALSRERVIGYQQDAGSANTATMTMDPADVLVHARYQEEGADFSYSCTYYEDGSRHTITYPSGVVVTENRDVTGRLLGISDQSGNIASVSKWKGQEEPSEVKLGSSIQQNNQFDKRGRRTGSRSTRTSDNSVITHIRTQFDLANNVEAEQFLHRGARTDFFTHDNGERVSGAQVGAIPLVGGSLERVLYERNYNYDPTGLDFLDAVSVGGLIRGVPAFATNWTSHDSFLQPTEVDGFNRGTADSLGRVVRTELHVRDAGANSPTSIPAVLTHNGRGDLVRIERADGVTIENSYQPTGLRYLRRVSRNGILVEARHFIYDDEKRLLEEYDRTGDTPLLVARYYYGNGDAPLAGDLRNPGEGLLQRYYFLRDDADSVVAVADSDGNVIERVWYDPFGQPVIEKRDTASPVMKAILAGDENSILVALSETVSPPVVDPGPGEGIVQINPTDLQSALTVSVGGTSFAGTVQLLPQVDGFEPYSVLKFTPSGPLPSTPNGVLGWWPADVSVSDVVSGNNGALRGGATLASGLIQQSFALNGTNAYVEITNATALNFSSNNFTVSAWVNFNTTSGEQVLLEKWTQSTSTGWSLVKRADQRLRLLIGNGAGGQFIVESTAPANLPTNTWVQVAARRQGSQFTVFTNGTAIFTGTQTANLDSSSTLKFGSREGTSLFLNGRIDEVTIYSRALSDQEITSVAGGVAVPGPLTVTLKAGTLADEWGNTNETDEVSFMLADEQGTVLYSAQPDPDTAARKVARSSLGSPFLFHGQYFDYDTGLIYLRARFYDPFSGMFLEPDPMGYEDSVNPYAAMKNNPVAVRDPSGLSGLGLVEDAINLGGKVMGELPHAASMAKDTMGSRLLAQAKSFDEPLKQAVASKLTGLLKNLKMDSGFLGLVKPEVASLDMTLKEAYIKIAKSDDFAKAIAKYNRYAEKSGVTKSVDAETVVKHLEENTFFSRVSNSKGAFWDHTEMGELGKYWIQGDPFAGFGFPAFASGRQTAIHEMLHMGATINGQVNQLREAANVSKKLGSRIMSLHENAVQLSSTPGTYAAMSALKGVGYTAGGLCLWGGASWAWQNVSARWSEHQMQQQREQWMQERKKKGL